MPQLVIRKDTTRSDSLLLTEDLGGLSAPDGWTNAPLCFRVSDDGVEYTDLKDEDGNIVEVKMEPPGTFLDVPAAKKAPFPAGSYLMLVSGTPDYLVPQAMDRVFEVYFAAGKAATAKKGALKEEKEHQREHEKEPSKDDHPSTKKR